MTNKEFDIDSIFLCTECGFVDISPEINECPMCESKLEKIGFLEVGKKSDLGGSVKEGNCKCGNPRASKGIDGQGRRRYRTQCYRCLYKARTIVKEDSCKICGVTPEDKSQLHKDHIDGDRSNNTMKNIQTLCADCHKYKTNKQKDWKKKNV